MLHRLRIAQRWEQEGLYTVHDIKYFCQGIAMFQQNKTVKAEPQLSSLFIFKVEL